MTPRTPEPVRAVVFDMDGVITDSERLWDEVRRGLAAEDGAPWPDEATEAMMGMSTQEWSAYLVGTVGLRGTAEEAARRTIDGVAAHYHVELPLMPGAVAAIHRLAARWPLGIASSSPRRLIDAVLEELDVTHVFGATVSTEEVGAGKPAPDGYLRVCELLGVEPTAAVAIEDSSNGVRSAAAAGMTVVAVPHEEYGIASDARALAAVELGSLDEVTVELVEALGRR